MNYYYSCLAGVFLAVSWTKQMQVIHSFGTLAVVGRAINSKRMNQSTATEDSIRRIKQQSYPSKNEGVF